MSIQTLLSRLNKVRKSGPASWVACCPAHQDRSPSLSIKDNNGTILLHCFGGCSVHEILVSVEMDMEDLFPPKDEHFTPSKSRPFPLSDILRTIAHEAMIVAASAATMRGRPLTEDEITRLMESSAKINAALTAGGINHG